MKPQAVIYCRVSSEEQVKNLSLGTQEKKCREYNEQQDFETNRVFTDKGESAKTTDRTHFREMLQYCRENRGRIHYVIVYNLSRFARNHLDHNNIRALLAKYGIKLRSATEPIDDSAIGKYLENNFASIAQLDNDLKSERTITGMSEAIEIGFWPFREPLGYMRKYNPADPDERGEIVHDPERAPYVLQAFTLFATGQYTEQEVLRLVTAQGLRTRKGKPVSHQIFSAMLQNPIYAGILSVDNWNKRKRGNFTPIVDEELFYRVQKLLSGSPVIGKLHLRNHPDFPLRNFTKCKTCGRALTGSYSKGRNGKFPYYRCQTKKCLNIRKEKMETLFIDYLQRLQPQPECLKLFKEIVLRVWKQRRATLHEQVKALRKRVDDMELKKQKVVDAFVFEKAISKEIYDQQLAKIDEDIAIAKLEMHETESDEFDVEAGVNYAEYVLSDVARLWTEFSDEPKRKLQAVLFPQGVEFSGSEFGTAVTPLIFKMIPKSPTQNAGLVLPVG